MVYTPYPSVTAVSGFVLDAKFLGCLESVSHSQLPATPHLRKFPEVTMMCGTGMSGDFYAWVADSFTKFIYHDASIITSGSGSDPWSNRARRLALKNAQVTEIGFPALDAASKDPATLSIKFRAESAQTLSGGLSFNLPPKSRPHPTHFRFQIDGLDEPCQQISKLGPVVAKGMTDSGAVGHHSGNTMRGVMQSEVAVTLPAMAAAQIQRSLCQPFRLAQGSIQIDVGFGLVFGLKLTALTLCGPALLVGGEAQPVMQLRMRCLPRPFFGPRPFVPVRVPQASSV